MSFPYNYSMSDGLLYITHLKQKMSNPDKEFKQTVKY